MALLHLASDGEFDAVVDEYSEPARAGTAAQESRGARLQHVPNPGFGFLHPPSFPAPVELSCNSSVLFPLTTRTTCASMHSSRITGLRPQLFHLVSFIELELTASSRSIVVFSRILYTKSFPSFPTTLLLQEQHLLFDHGVVLHHAQGARRSGPHHCAVVAGQSHAQETH